MIHQIFVYTSVLETSSLQYENQQTFRVIYSETTVCVYYLQQQILNNIYTLFFAIFVLEMIGLILICSPLNDSNYRFSDKQYLNAS